MKTELVIKKWAIETKEGKTIITGQYAVMLGSKEIATSSFNTDFGGTDINFDREVEDAARELTNKISESIQKSFTN